MALLLLLSLCPLSVRLLVMIGVWEWKLGILYNSYSTFCLGWVTGLDDVMLGVEEGRRKGWLCYSSQS